MIEDRAIFKPTEGYTPKNCLLDNDYGMFIEFMDYFPGSTLVIEDNNFDGKSDGGGCTVGSFSPAMLLLALPLVELFLRK